MGQEAGRCGPPMRGGAGGARRMERAGEVELRGRVGGRCGRGAERRRWLEQSR